MRIVPILTEKSLNEAKNGKYSFWVSPSLNKFEIGRLVKETFGVNVVSVKTANAKKMIKKNNRGKMTIVPAIKKAIVELKDKEKIDLFEESTKGK